jgi:hypothetical protein
VRGCSLPYGRGKSKTAQALSLDTENLLTRADTAFCLQTETRHSLRTSWQLAVDPCRV